MAELPTDLMLSKWINTRRSQLVIASKCAKSAQKLHTLESKFAQSKIWLPQRMNLADDFHMCSVKC